MILAYDQQMVMGEAGLKPKLQFNPHSARLQERKGPTVMNVFQTISLGSRQIVVVLFHCYCLYPKHPRFAVDQE